MDASGFEKNNALSNKQIKTAGREESDRPWQAVKKASLKLLGCMKGPQPLHLYAPRYCHTASAGFGRRFAKSPALSRLWRRY